MLTELVKYPKSNLMIINIVDTIMESREVWIFLFLPEVVDSSKTKTLKTGLAQT
jgi:hypothetical protein